MMSKSSSGGIDAFAELEAKVSGHSVQMDRLTVMVEKVLKEFELANSRASQPIKQEPADNTLNVNDLKSVDNAYISSMMGKDEKKPATAPAATDPRKPSMFINLSVDDVDGGAAGKFGNIAKILGKELKSIYDSSTKKSKLKTASSFAEWERKFNKHLRKLDDVAIIICYLEFVAVVNKLNCFKSWPVACAYTWLWLKTDAAATKGKVPPLNASEISSDLLFRAEAKAAESKLKSTTPAGSSGSKKTKYPCFNCMGPHFVSLCPYLCPLCGSKSHSQQRCPCVLFQTQSQPQAGVYVGGPQLVPTGPPLLQTPIVCFKCCQPGHTAAHCHMR
jgi:hypothetical protein